MARARLLDLTRSLRRADRGATGVDRVERAYLSHLLSQDTQLFGLVRTPIGYLLLDRKGLAAFQERLQGQVPWGRATLLSRLGTGRSAALKRAESDLRRLACGRARRGKLSGMFGAWMPDGFDYFNTGHSNLTDRVFDAVKDAGGQAHVLIHDVIPLSHPEYQRPGTVETFRTKLTRVSARADRVIYNSADTRQQAEAMMQQMGRVPPCIVAHLGTIAPCPDASALPDGMPPDVRYFITVGTIEPRKNHAFLLDIWDEMGPDAPPLLICGARGWNNAEVFARLDSVPADGPVKELSGLTDAALADLVQNSAGMLFPSHVEGFGLPPLEALTLGTRVLCNDLGVLREFLYEKPVYASVTDRYLWISTVKSWTNDPETAHKIDGFVGPTWAEHFKTVLRLT